MRRVAALVLSLVSACATDPGPDPTPEPEPTPEPTPEPDLTAPLFDPTRVIDVSITLPAADWDALRMQTRSASDLFGSCPTGPRPSPFTTFRATVIVDGQVLAQVGLRKKGFYGSLDEERPSLRIKTDEYVAGQKLFGLKSLTLNNAKQDPALIRQCLTYQVFAKAGVPAPRCNFARVRVNGASLGTYVNVEPINKPFLRRHFTSDAGNLYEGTISDFRPGWTGTFDKKTNDSNPDRSDLDAVATALAKPDGELLAALEPLVDVDEFIDYWAAEILVNHTDSYSGLANNFFVYADPASGKFVFMPWGVDQTFTDGSVINGTNAAVAANGLLARRLYLLPATRDRYLARLRSLLDTAWNETELLAEVDRMAVLIGAPSNEVEAVRTFVRGREQVLLDALAGGPPAWTATYRADARPCFEANGTMTGTFATRWGTLGAPDVFAAGTGTLGGTADGAPVTPQRVGATSGSEDGHATIVVFGDNGDGTLTLVYIVLDPSEMVAPSDVWIGGRAAALRYNPTTGDVVALGIPISGTLHLDAASQVNGGSVRGALELGLVRAPF